MNLELVDNHVVFTDVQSEEEQKAVAEFLEIVGNKSPVEALKELCISVQDSYYDIGRILYHLKESGEYQKVNPSYVQPNNGGWQQFCEEQLEGISYRTAQYWLNIFKYFDSMGVDKERVKALGWSKAKELINYTELPDRLEAALVVAEDSSIAELKAYIEEETRPVGEDTRELTINKKFSFFLQEEPAKAAQEVLDELLLLNDGDLNSAFFQLCIDWRTLFHPQIPVEINVEESDLV